MTHGTRNMMILMCEPWYKRWNLCGIWKDKWKYCCAMGRKLEMLGHEILSGNIDGIGREAWADTNRRNEY
jgi:hypothetical protein